MDEDDGGGGEVSSGGLREASRGVGGNVLVRSGDGRRRWLEERTDGVRTHREVWMRDSSSSSCSERKI